jgi:TolB-like protein
MRLEGAFHLRCRGFKLREAVRKALGDNGENQNFIRTVRGRGFLFTAPVVGVAEVLGTSRSLEARKQTQTESPVQSKPLSAPKIAVLPLFPLSQDPQLGLLGDAVAQEIILELSRLHWLFVIARGSTFQFRGQEVDLAQASRILGARYFLTGTIMKEARNCIIALELCSAPGRSHDHASARHHAHAFNRCRKDRWNSMLSTPLSISPWGERSGSMVTWMPHCRGLSAVST